MKWETVGKLKKGSGFDRSVSPYQDFKYLFNFRNDLVHDKVVDYKTDRARNRYGGHLPDPVFGMLELEHALYAADTYWAMVEQVHRLTGYPRAAFHRHYNLSPWFNDEFKAALMDAATQYKHIVHLD